LAGSTNPRRSLDSGNCGLFNPGEVIGDTKAEYSITCFEIAQRVEQLGIDPDESKAPPAFGTSRGALGRSDRTPSP
jgi:hypothetical protein